MQLCYYFTDRKRHVPRHNVHPPLLQKPHWGLQQVHIGKYSGEEYAEKAYLDIPDFGEVEFHWDIDRALEWLTSTETDPQNTVTCTNPRRDLTETIQRLDPNIVHAVLPLPWAMQLKTSLAAIPGNIFHTCWQWWTVQSELTQKRYQGPSRLVRPCGLGDGTCFMWSKVCPYFAYGAYS